MKHIYLYSILYMYTLFPPPAPARQSGGATLGQRVVHFPARETIGKLAAFPQTVGETYSQREDIILTHGRFWRTYV